MSHSLTAFSGNVYMVKLTIVNYSTGGEAVTPAELGATTTDGVVLGQVPANQNSLAVPLFPVLSSGKIVLFQFVSGSPVEIPPTTNLNAVLSAMVHLSGILNPI